jgi:uncharacterized protein YbbK (DUF523 family)
MTKRPAPAAGRGRPVPPPRLRIGISACLLGHPVRYDGTHRYQAWTEDLDRLVEWVPVCPEVELGLGTPREPIHLVAPAKSSPAAFRDVGTGSSPRRKVHPGHPESGVVTPATRMSPRRAPGSSLDACPPDLDSGPGLTMSGVTTLRRNDGRAAGMIEDDPPPRVLGVETGRDHTRRMTAYAAARLRDLARLDLCGFIFKDRSPSCGPEGVPVQTPRGVATTGTGLFARAVRARFPGLPVTGEERLRDPAARAAFLRRVRAYAAARAGRRPPARGAGGHAPARR